MGRIYTLGHSRHAAERFLDLLEAQEISRLVDVRSHPVSRWAPHFAKAVLARLLAAQAIDYVYLGRELGGRPEDPAFYQADGSLDLERRSEAADFQAGIARLVELAGERKTVILCAEEDPTRCHRRRLLAPALQRAGLQVLHLRGDGRVEPESDGTPQLDLFRSS
jgi:uncharacterized protein (DUF488 family)